jgi:type IV secretion system protein VirB8
MSSPAGISGYFAEAQSWDADRNAQQQRSVRVAWCTATAGWVCAMAGAVAIATMMPLKQVEPFLIRVDNSTGIVDVVPALDATASPDESVTRYFLTHYVSVCERFNFSTAESDYEECGAFHSAQRNQVWYAAWAKTNPASPLNVHKDGSLVRVQVQSVSFFSRASGMQDLAQVRYVKALSAGPGAEERFSHWIATVQFAYSDASHDPKVRRWNPLGFKVVDFRPEPEVIPSPGTVEPTT